MFSYSYTRWQEGFADKQMDEVIQVKKRNLGLGLISNAGIYSLFFPEMTVNL